MFIKLKWYLEQQRAANEIIAWLADVDPEAVVLCTIKWKDGLYTVNSGSLKRHFSENGYTYQLFDPQLTVDLEADERELFRNETIVLATKHMLPTIDREITRSSKEIVRNIIQNETVTQKPSENLRRPFVTGMDIAFWIGGEIRASIVLQYDITHETLPYILSKALRDGRFKPITLSEVDDMSIEYSLFYGPIVSLGRTDILRNQINPSRGLTAKSAGKTGWYIPLVHNEISYRSLTGMIYELITKKMAVPMRSKYDRVSQFNTTGLHISPDDTYIKLHGPVPSPSLDEVTPDNIKNRLQFAGDHLCGLIDESGFLLPVIRPEKTTSKRLDLTRQAFSIVALSELHAFLPNDYYIQSAELMEQFVLKHISLLNDQSTALVYAYLSQAHYKKNDEEAARDYAMKALNLYTKNNFENTVVRSQIARALLPFDTEQTTQLVEALFEKFHFQQLNNPGISLAKFAELITLSKLLRADNGKTKDWFIAQQASDGSFPNTASYSQPYVRGTGKILETLAEVGSDYGCVKRGIAWLFTMQYTSHTIYHIPNHLQSQVTGGFRHDHFNREVWADGTAHVILTLTRYLQQHTD